MKEILITILILLFQFSYSQDMDTEIIPVLNHELNGKNILYCPTFEISWYNLQQTFFNGENIIVENSPDYLKYLNDTKVNINDYSLTNSLIFSGIVKSRTADSLNSIKERDFPEIQTNFTDYIGSLISYACIDLKLKYQTSFQIWNPTRFNGISVESFGFQYNPEDNLESGKQVSIIDYKGPDDFIIEISLSNDDFELYLAKIPPEKNVCEIYNQAKSRIRNGKRETLVNRDILQIPIIDLNTKRIYTELMNIGFKNKCCQEQSLDFAFQSIKFRMDEKGVDMISESISGWRDPPKHRMVFNRPFLIIIMNKQSNSPIFLGWIENSQFMIKY